MRYTHKHVRALAFQINRFRDERRGFLGIGDCVPAKEMLWSKQCVRDTPDWVVKHANRLARDWREGIQKP